MISTARLRAQSLLNLAMKIAPPERAVWFEAMLGEMDHMPDTELSRFVCGCMIAAIQERIVSPAFILVGARWFLVGGAMAWAAMNLWFAGRMSAANAASLELFALCVAAVFGVGAITTARFGFKTTIALGAPFMLMLAIAALTLKIMLPHSSNTTLYVALIIEDLFVLALAMLVAFATPHMVLNRGASGQ